MNDIKELSLNENLEQTFSELIKKDRLPHAILIDGGDGEKRDRTAKFLAASFICSEDNRPCGKCTNCVKAFSDNHPDIIISNPESLNEKTFKIGLVRDIRSDAFVLPNEAIRKVYVLKSADKMNIQAQNALLKIIEEPPSYARFILECDSRASMLDTIMSRVTAFNLGKADSRLNDEYLQKADDYAVRLAESLLKPTELDFMRITAEFEKDKELFEPVISSIQLIFRDAAVIKTGSTAILGRYRQTSEQLASKFTLKALTKLVENCSHFYDCLNKNANKNLLMTRFSSVLRQSAYGA